MSLWTFWCSGGAAAKRAHSWKKCKERTKGVSIKSRWRLRYLKSGVHQDVHAGPAADRRFPPTSLGGRREKQAAGGRQPWVWRGLSRGFLSADGNAKDTVEHGRPKHKNKVVCHLFFGTGLCWSAAAGSRWRGRGTAARCPGSSSPRWPAGPGWLGAAQRPPGCMTLSWMSFPGSTSRGEGRVRADYYSLTQRLFKTHVQNSRLKMWSKTSLICTTELFGLLSIAKYRASVNFSCRRLQNSLVKIRKYEDKLAPPCASKGTIIKLILLKTDENFLPGLMRQKPVRCKMPHRALNITTGWFLKVDTPKVSNCWSGPQDHYKNTTWTVGPVVSDSKCSANTTKTRMLC